MDCKAIAISEIINHFGIISHDGGKIEITLNLPEAKRNQSAIVSRKSEMFSFWDTEKIYKADAAKKAATKLATNVSGLDIVRDAIATMENYHYQFDVAMERGDGIFPAKPEIDIDALKIQYPVATAYIMAESFENASDYNKSAAGRKARAAIAEGNDCVQAIVDMKSEWDNAAEQAVWNN